MDDALQEFLDELQRANDGETCFVVEGKRDVAALQQQGLRHVMSLDNALYLFCEQVAEQFRKAVILTDLDAEGKSLYGKIKNYLSRNGIIINDKPRDLLWKTELRQIEGLTTYLERTKHI